MSESQAGVEDRAEPVPEDCLGDPSVRAVALARTTLITTDHVRIRKVATDVVGGAAGVEAAQRLYEFVRDDIPYGLAPGHRTYLPAHEVLDRPRATCVPKAILLTALLRASGVPTLVSFYDVRDHKVGRRLREMLRTDTYPWHAVPRLHLDGTWVRLECSVDRALAERQGWQPIEFSATTDQLMRPTAVDGSPHWEVLTDHGTWTGFPVDRMREGLQRMYGVRNGPAELLDRGGTG